MSELHSVEYQRGYDAGYRAALRDLAMLKQHAKKLKDRRPKVARFI